jgi:hypothetical protein
MVCGEKCGERVAALSGKMVESIRLKKLIGLDG